MCGGASANSFVIKLRTPLKKHSISKNIKEGIEE
jgi:hypothetical protein